MQSTSVWALPPDDVTGRIKNLMTGLRSAFGVAQLGNFEPHVTVVEPIRLTEDDARNKFREACAGLKAYRGVLDRVASGTFFYQCIYLLLLHPPEELSLLFGDLTDEEKSKATEKAKTLDQSIEEVPDNSACTVPNGH